MDWRAERVFRDSRKEFKRVKKEVEVKGSSDCEKSVREASASNVTRMSAGLTRENEAIAAEIPSEGVEVQKLRRMKDWEEKKRGLDEMCRDLKKLSDTGVAEEADVSGKCPGHHALK